MNKPATQGQNAPANMNQQGPQGMNRPAPQGMNQQSPQGMNQQANMGPASPQPQNGTVPVQGKPNASPQPSAGNKPMPGQSNAQNLNTVDIKQRLRSEYPGSFNVDADFAPSKVYSVCSQGFRFRMDRTKTDMNTGFVLISKKGGLIKPNFLVADAKIQAKEITIKNTITGKPFVTIKDLGKGETWEVINHDLSDAKVGTIKKTQQKSPHENNRELSYHQTNQNNAAVATLVFKCPIQKSGFCSSHKPSNLHYIDMSLKVNGLVDSVEIEENPNAEECKQFLETNVHFRKGVDSGVFVALVSLLEVMTHELH